MKKKKATESKFDEFLVDRIKQRLKNAGTIEMKSMMGGLIFMLNDKMCVGVDKDRESGENRLMVRVGKEMHGKLLHQRGSSEMKFTGKSLSGFLFVSPEGFDTDEDLDFWMEHALAFNRVAEAKPKRKRT